MSIVSEFEGRFRALVHECELAGLAVTIERSPVPPYSMGRMVHVVHVRVAHAAAVARSESGRFPNHR